MLNDVCLLTLPDFTLWDGGGAQANRLARQASKPTGQQAYGTSDKKQAYGIRHKKQESARSLGAACGVQANPHRRFDVCLLTLLYFTYLLYGNRGGGGDPIRKYKCSK